MIKKSIVLLSYYANLYRLHSSNEFLFITIVRFVSGQFFETQWFDKLNEPFLVPTNHWQNSTEFTVTTSTNDTVREIVLSSKFRTRLSGIKLI